MRRVVVTGLGLVTPLASGVSKSWERLIAGNSGIGAIQSFDVSDLPCKIAGQVLYGDSADGGFDPVAYVEAKDLRKNDRFIIYGIAAGQQAVEDSGWMPSDEEAQERTGVMVGSGIGGTPLLW